MSVMVWTDGFYQIQPFFISHLISTYYSIWLEHYLFQEEKVVFEAQQQAEYERKMKALEAQIAEDKEKEDARAEKVGGGVKKNIHFTIV